MAEMKPFDYFLRHGEWPTFGSVNNVERMKDESQRRRAAAAARSPRSPKGRSPRSPKGRSPRSPKGRSPRSPKGVKSTGRRPVSPRSRTLNEAVNIPLPASPPNTVNYVRGTATPPATVTSPRRTTTGRSSGSMSPRRRAMNVPLPNSPSSPSSPSRSRMASPPRMSSPGVRVSPSGRELKPPRVNEGRWRDEKPQSKEERDAMHAREPECFLGKRKDGSPGYPICSKGTTRVSCGGVVAAKRRGAQYKQYDVVQKAEEINQRYGCTKKAVKEKQQRRAVGRTASPRRR